MSQQLAGQWATFINCIDQHTITYLIMHSRLLQVNSKSQLASEDALANIREELNSVLTELLHSDVEFEVKKYLSRNLRKLIAAIDEYKLTGNLAIFDAIEILMGHSVFDAKYKNLITEHVIGKRIVDAIGLLADVMTIATGLPQISGTITTLIAISPKL
jgi:hypothetical protein